MFGGLGVGLGGGGGGDGVEVDVAETAPFLFVEGDHRAFALEAHRLPADLRAEGGVLVVLIVAEDEPGRSGPAGNLLDVAHIDLSLHPPGVPAAWPESPIRTAYGASLGHSDAGIGGASPRWAQTGRRPPRPPSRCCGRGVENRRGPRPSDEAVDRSVRRPNRPRPRDSVDLQPQ